MPLLRIHALGPTKSVLDGAPARIEGSPILAPSRMHRAIVQHRPAAIAAHRIGGLCVRDSLTKPKNIAPKPTTKPIATARAMYGATAELTRGFPFLGMQHQSTAPAADNTKIPCTHNTMVPSCE